MSRANFAITAAVLLFCSLGQLTAVQGASVVTFDDAAGNALLFQGVSPGDSFVDQGLQFTNFGAALYVWDASSPNSNGTNNNIFAGFADTDYEAITLAGGGSFSLLSIDLAISWYDPNPTETITINGNPLTITQTLTTYNLNLMNVTEVDISGVPSLIGYWLADNVTYSAVPEPASATMLIVGFGAVGMAAYGRKRRKSAVV
jgi:PEP-CTERM motif